MQVDIYRFYISATSQGYVSLTRVFSFFFLGVGGVSTQQEPSSLTLKLITNHAMHSIPYDINHKFDMAQIKAQNQRLHISTSPI